MGAERRKLRWKLLLPELTVNEPSHRGRNILSIILSIIVLLLISSLIVAAIVIINPEITNLTSSQQKVREAITLEEALLGELSPNDFNSFWLPPTDRNAEAVDHLMYEDAKTLYLVTLPHGSQQTNFTSSQQTSGQFKPNVTVLVSNSSLLASIDYQGAKLSPSKRYLLIWTARRRQFRHSYTAKYFLYDIKLDLISLISTKAQEHPATGRAAPGNQSATSNQLNHYDQLDTASLYLYEQPSSTYDESFVRFQLAEWYSSNFTTNNGPNEPMDSLILVQNNDIYTLPNVAALSGSENVQTKSTPSVPIRLTYTGKLNEISNGVPDWLYEEEILSDSPAYQVSPSSNYLAYLSFNDSLVALMPYSIYVDYILPRVQRIRYPKAGQPNPLVSVHVIDNLAQFSSYQNRPEVRDIRLSLPDDLELQQHYINRINWLTNDKLAVIWSNRNQNESYILICSKSNVTLQWSCMKNLHLQAANGWLDIGDDLVALDDDHYLALIPKFEGNDVGSFKHIAKVSLHRPNDLVYLTGGRKDVCSINGIDRQRSLCYYTSTVVGQPGQRQVFATTIDTAMEHGIGRATPIGTDFSKVEETKPSVCLTCSHHRNACLFNFIKMSPSTKHYIFQCDGPDVPRTELRTTRYFMYDWSSRSAPGIPDRLTSNDISREQSQDDSLLWTIEDNLDLRNKLESSKAMPLTVRLQIPIQNTSYMADVLLLLPPQMGPSTTFRATSTLAAAAAAQANSRPRREISQPQTISNRESPAATKAPPVYETDNLRRKNLFENLDYESLKEYTSQLPSGQQYPMVVDVYGGPGSQKVDYRFHMYFGHYLASARRTVYVMIDGRGSGHQGSKRLFELYHRLGTVEIQDQIDTTAQLTKMLPFVDASKVAIWGWSYGGYAAAMSLAQSNARAMDAIQAHIRSLKGQSELFAATSGSLEPAAAARPAGKLESMFARAKFHAPWAAPMLPPFRGVFECAASVAPVTNWIYYDTAYTEKYMSSPWANELYDELISRDHLANQNNQEPSPVARQKISRNQQRPEVLAPNRWTHLNHSTLESVNSSAGRPTQSQLMDLLARSASSSQQPQSNSTSQQLQQPASGLKFRPYGPHLARSPMYNELNERYKKASLLDQIGNIDRKRFLLIHGTADDNVHFQQSIMLMKQLIKRNILFESRLYPDQDHSIANRADKLHLGSTLSNFFAECFDMAY